MNRLLEGDGTEVEQDLLDALRLERPSPELEQRMRAAIGLLPIAASVAPPPVTPAAPAAKTLGTWGALAAGSVVVAAFVGGGAWLGSDEASVEAPPEPPARIVTPSEPAEPAPTPAVAPETKAPDQAVGPTPMKPRAQPSHAVSSASLREEIRLIDSARVAVKAKEGARAVQILDGYARRFPSGTFKEEARLLRAEALKQR